MQMVRNMQIKGVTEHRSPAIKEKNLESEIETGHPGLCAGRYQANDQREESRVRD